MSKIKIERLEATNSTLKDLNYWETEQIIGGAGEISSKESINQAIQDALTRQDLNQNSSSK